MADTKEQLSHSITTMRKISRSKFAVLFYKKEEILHFAKILKKLFCTVL